MRARSGRIGLGFGLGMALASTSAADVDGVYRLTKDGDCDAIGQAGGAIRVQDRVLYGVESQCRMLNPQPVRNMDAELVDMVCTGEGTEWTERAMVMRGAKDELILVWNGYAFAYPRCPNVAPLVTDATRPHRRPTSDSARETARPKARPEGALRQNRARPVRRRVAP